MVTRVKEVIQVIKSTKCDSLLFFSTQKLFFSDSKLIIMKNDQEEAKLELYSESKVFILVKKLSSVTNLLVELSRKNSNICENIFSLIID